MSCSSGCVFECIGIDPGIRNVGLARAIVRANVSFTEYQVVHKEVYRLDLLDEKTWNIARQGYAKMCHFRSRSIQNCLHSSGSGTSNPLIKSTSNIKHWRSWKTKPPTSSRKVTQREMADLIFAIASWIVPVDGTIPRTVYIEAQPAGRASNAKTCCVSLSIFSALRERMRHARVPPNLIAVELVPPQRKYTLMGSPEPKIALVDSSSCPSNHGNSLDEKNTSRKRKRPKTLYKQRKTNSCSFAKGILNEWESHCISQNDMDGTHISNKEPMLNNIWNEGINGGRMMRPENGLHQGKSDDIADAVILCKLAIMDTMEYIHKTNHIKC